MLNQRKIEVCSPVFQIFQSPLQTYIALQVLLQSEDSIVMVYRQDNLELIHQHDEEYNDKIFVSFDESEQYMLVYVEKYFWELSRITIYRTSDFKAYKQIQLKHQLLAAYFQNEKLLILFNSLNKMVQQFDIETENTVDLFQYDDVGICTSLNQVKIIRNIRKFNPHLKHKSMNQDIYLAAFQYLNAQFTNILIICLVKYDVGKNNKIIKTNRYFICCKDDKFDSYFSFNICTNTQFKVLYQLNSAKLIKGNKITRKYKQVEYISCLTIKYPMKYILIPQNTSITFL